MPNGQRSCSGAQEGLAAARPQAFRVRFRDLTLRCQTWRPWQATSCGQSASPSSLIFRNSSRALRTASRKPCQRV